MSELIIKGLYFLVLLKRPFAGNVFVQNRVITALTASDVCTMWSRYVVTLTIAKVRNKTSYSRGQSKITAV